MSKSRFKFLSALSGNEESLRWAFSTITIEASTIAPMAIAMPPSDMILAVIPWPAIIINAANIPSGKVIIATRALRACNRKRKVIRATIRLSSKSLCSKYSTEPSMSLLRSYTTFSSTPSGNPCLTDCSLSLISSMTLKAFAPGRITTMPPTASPIPFSSVMPRRMDGPSTMRATSPRVTGVPSTLLRTVCSKSSGFVTYPNERIRYSVSAISSVRPPVSLLAPRVA